MKNNRFGQAKVLDTQELDLVIKYLKTENQYFPTPPHPISQIRISNKKD